MTFEGKRLEHYYIYKKIGNGDDATVYTAFRDDSYVAIKITKKRSKEPECLKRLSKYIFFPKIYETIYFEYEGEDYIAIIMEYLKDYITLKDYLLQYRYNDEDIVKKKIIDAYTVMINEGISHNDLHMENIMINPISLNIKIIDFGDCNIKSKIVHNYDELIKLFKEMNQLIL